MRGGVRGGIRGAVRGGREWAGWVLLAVGAVLCVLGWYGVSGERFVEQQVPYLASSTVPGAALIVSGALLLALRPSGGFGDGNGGAGGDGCREATDRRVERLYELLVEPVDAPDSPDAPGSATPAVTTGPLALPEGTRYHRPDCPLIAGKARAVPVDDEAVRERGLTPCPLCDPGPGDGSGAGPGVEPGEGPGVRPGEADPADG
ncbi:hypothetical protein ACIBCA_08995 [Kitasatospora sp. NPDC051170]|uniref:hypothetical protein n=1 Tax=Kitasatospora sp. NPDC051170 TaxID=3364056 RepID=UPI0037BD399C